MDYEITINPTVVRIASQKAKDFLVATWSCQATSQREDNKRCRQGVCSTMMHDCK